MIIRTTPRRSFTVLPNGIFRTGKGGLLAYLLSLSPNWEIRPQLIAKAMSPEGNKRAIGSERLRRMFGDMILCRKTCCTERIWRR
jgi:hypothetical protein